MKIFKKISCLLLLFTLSFNLISCNFTSYENVQKEFDTFLSDEFKDYVNSDSITLHYTLKNPENYNITKSKITLGNISASEFEQYSKDVSNTLKELKNFDYSKLTKDQQLTYDIYKEYLETEKEGSKYTYYTSLLSPTIGLQANLPITLAEYKFYNKEDVTEYIEILNLINSYFDGIIDYEKEKSKKGLFMSDFAVNDIVNQCNEFISNPEENYLISTFNSKINELNNISEDEKKEFIKQNKDAVINSVIPAYQKLINALEKLKGTGTNDGGLCNFPDGKKYYKYLVKSNTGSDKSINEIKKLLETRLTNLFDQMNKIINNSPEVLQVFGSETYESNNPNEILEILQERIKDYYPDAPKTEYSVRHVDKSLEENLSPAFYMIPPIDDYTSNTIYINDKQVNNINLFPTLAHEGYPGHLYQVTYFNSTNPNPLRNVLNFGGYTEGWATYVEIQSYELANFNNEPLVELSQVYSEITLAIPTIIDIGVNYDGWNLDDTKKYITSLGYDESIAEPIYKSVIEEPANYLQYYIGYLEFDNLKDYASNKLKDNFNLKEFNKTLLDVGPAPFTIVKDKVDEYIKNANLK